VCAGPVARTPAESSKVPTRFDARGDEPRQTEFDLQGQLSVGTPISIAGWRAVSLPHAVAASSLVRAAGGPTLILFCNPANNEVKAGAADFSLPTASPYASGQAHSPGFQRNLGQALSAAASPAGLTLPQRLGGRAGDATQWKRGVEPLQVIGISCLRAEGLQTDGQAHKRRGRGRALLGSLGSTAEAGAERVARLCVLARLVTGGIGVFDWG